MVCVLVFHGRFTAMRFLFLYRATDHDLPSWEIINFWALEHIRPCGTGLLTVCYRAVDIELPAPCDTRPGTCSIGLWTIFYRAFYNVVQDCKQCVTGAWTCSTGLWNTSYRAWTIFYKVNEHC